MLSSKVIGKIAHSLGFSSVDEYLKSEKHSGVKLVNFLRQFSAEGSNIFKSNKSIHFHDLIENSLLSQNELKLYEPIISDTELLNYKFMSNS